MNWEVIRWIDMCNRAQFRHKNLVLINSYKCSGPRNLSRKYGEVIYYGL
jgi:hypothetical protein